MNLVFGDTQKESRLFRGGNFEPDCVLLVPRQNGQVPPVAVSHLFFSSSAILRLLFSGKRLDLSAFALPCNFLSFPTLPAVPLLAPFGLSAAPCICSRSIRSSSLMCQLVNAP